MLRARMSYTENRKIYHDYEILETYEAGLKLLGHEAKAITVGKASLVGARVILRAGEAFLVGANIQPYQTANTPKGYDPVRARKLLLHKKELGILVGKEAAKGLTILPLKLYNKNSKIKLLFGIVRAKKKHDKRESQKKKTAKRDIERSLKNS